MESSKAKHVWEEGLGTIQIPNLDVSDVECGSRGLSMALNTIDENFDHAGFEGGVVL